jgi:hypothetical protein
MRRVFVIVFAAVLCVPGRAAQNIVAQTGSQLRSGSTASIAQLYTFARAEVTDLFTMQDVPEAPRAIYWFTYPGLVLTPARHRLRLLFLIAGYVQWFIVIPRFVNLWREMLTTKKG